MATCDDNKHNSSCTKVSGISDANILGLVSISGPLNGLVSLVFFVPVQHSIIIKHPTSQQRRYNVAATS